MTALEALQTLAPVQVHQALQAFQTLEDVQVQKIFHTVQSLQVGYSLHGNQGAQTVRAVRAVTF